MSNDTHIAALFAAATGEQEVSKAEILELASHCSAHEINVLINDLDRECKALRRASYDLATTIGFLTDEIKNRAEKLEAEKITT